MAQPGAIGYVLINFDGIPVKHFPDNLPAVQYSALVSDLVMKTKSTLKQLNQADSEFGYLRMRTK
jgi:predicted regulator of Ras-like GTPase activity (Roadblock/LC7/MglB family)